MSKKLKVFIS